MLSALQCKTTVFLSGLETLCGLSFSAFGLGHGGMVWYIVAGARWFSVELGNSLVSPTVCRYMVM